MSAPGPLSLVGDLPEVETPAVFNAEGDADSRSVSNLSNSNDNNNSSNNNNNNNSLDNINNDNNDNLDSSSSNNKNNKNNNDNDHDHHLNNSSTNLEQDSGVKGKNEIVDEEEPNSRDIYKAIYRIGSATIADLVVQVVTLPVNYIVVPIMTWLRWVPSSKAQLQQAEQRVLALTTKPYEVVDVDIGCLGDVENCKIHTIKVCSSSSPPATPLVLVHGFGCGGAIFAPSLDVLSEKRDVYAIDMVGFGLSSRAALSECALEAERQMVHSIETWRDRLGLERFVLLGHSLGGFVSSAYALRHPSRVRHLILEDPWGFPEYDPTRRSRVPLWGRAIMNSLEYVNALSAVRAAGPAGFGMMKKVLGTRHYYMGEYFPEMPDTIPTYLYHCNVRRPTGEDFFRHISQKFGFTRHPMIHRIGDLPRSIGMTFIHGSRTFITRTPSRILQEQRGKDNVDIYMVEDCGHTIHLERSQEFNEIVSKVLDRVDSTAVGGG